MGQEVSGLCGREDFGCQETIQRSLGSVVDPGPTAVAVAAVVDRFLGWGQKFSRSFTRRHSRFNTTRSSLVSYL